MKAMTMTDVKRAFSIAGMIQSGRRSKTAPDNLEDLLLLNSELQDFGSREKLECYVLIVDLGLNLYAYMYCTCNLRIT